MHSSPCGAIFLAVLFNLFNTAVISQCPNDQLRIDCSCFAKQHQSDKGVTWDSAKQRCSDIQATLASIQSPKENDMLGRYLKSGDNWIGLKAEVNSSLLLPNGEKATTLFPNVNKKSFDSRTCIAIRPNRIWTATGCDAVHRFICQRPLRKVCRKGWKPFNNLCYWISKTTLNFNKAKLNCTARAAKLAEISKKNDYEFLKKRLYDGADNIVAWFGLQKVGNVTKYTYSQSSEPNYTAIGVHFIPDISKHCVTMVLAKHDATWEAKKCDLKLNSYVCQTEINRDFNITVTYVNETSANISLSVNPSQCGLPRDSYFKLSDGSEVKRQEMVTNSRLMVNDLKPNRKYIIEITGTNVKKSTKKFQTTEIKNPLQLLRRISSTKIHAMIGDTVNLVCAVRGEPPIMLRWEKDKRKMESYLETEKPHRSSILSVKLSNQTSYGEYICHIQDQFSNMTHTFVVDSLPKDESEDNDQSFVIAIVILAITVAILLIIIAYFVNHLKLLKRKLNETKKVDTVTLKRIANEGGLYENQQELNAANKVTNEHNVSVEDENEAYTSLRRNLNEEEDNFYAPLREAPLYVNASEFKNTA